MLNIARNKKSKVFYPGQSCATVHCKGVNLQRKILQSSLWDCNKQGLQTEKSDCMKVNRSPSLP